MVGVGVDLRGHKETLWTNGGTLYLGGGGLYCAGLGVSQNTSNDKFNNVNITKKS